MSNSFGIDLLLGAYNSLPYDFAYHPLQASLCELRPDKSQAQRSQRKMFLCVLRASVVNPTITECKPFIALGNNYHFFQYSYELIVFRKMIPRKVE